MGADLAHELRLVEAGGTRLEERAEEEVEEGQVLEGQRLCMEVSVVSMCVFVCLHQQSTTEPSLPHPTNHPPPQPSTHRDVEADVGVEDAVGGELVAEDGHAALVRRHLDGDLALLLVQVLQAQPRQRRLGLRRVLPLLRRLERRRLLLLFFVFWGNTTQHNAHQPNQSIQPAYNSTHHLHTHTPAPTNGPTDLDDALEVVVLHAGLDLGEAALLLLLLLLLQRHVGHHAHGGAVAVLEQVELQRVLEHLLARRQVRLLVLCHWGVVV